MSDYEFWDELGKIFNAVLAYQEKTIAFNKRFINPWIRLGNVFDRQDHNREAIRAYQKAIEIDPENAQNWYELGNIYFRSGAYEEAVQAFNKAIELNPDLGWSFSNLALTLVTQGKYSEAVPLYLKSIDLLTEDKDRAVAWNRLGNVYRKLNEYERAVEAFQKADELDAENAGFRDDLDEVPTGISLTVEVPKKETDQPSEVPPGILQLVVEESQTDKTVVTSKPVVEPKTRPTAAVAEKPVGDESQSVQANARTVNPVLSPDKAHDETPPTPGQTAGNVPNGTAEASPTLSDSPKTTDATAPEVTAAQSTDAGNNTPSKAAVQPANVSTTADGSAQAGPADQSAETDQTVTIVVQNAVETYTEYTAVIDNTSETSEAASTVVEASVEPAVPAEEKPASTPEQKPEPAQPAQAAVDETTNKDSAPAEPQANENAQAAEIEVKKETEVVIVREVTTIEETLEEPAGQATDASLATGQVAYEEFLKDSVETVNLLPAQLAAENDEKPGPVSQQEPATRVNAAGELQIEMDTKNAHVWNELGNVYFNSCAYDDAIVAYSKAIELDRWFAWPYSNLALAYVQKGRFAEAILLYQRSIELFTSDKDKAISWNRLGNVYRRLNDYDNAISAYQRADEMDPDNSTLSLQSRFSLLGAYASDQKPNYVL